ncbi:MAG: TIGR00282 family metallophosphoesterase [Syntrophus sp. (in: bacteria)]|nr:TIGR00282 family metallophosphoesterase [Syntrophus sp. (in: bacteria)]
MKILFIGDIVGSPGRRAVRELVPGLIEDYRIDLVIANCENAAAGFGITREIVEELYRCRIDVLTSGNHVWDKKEVLEFVEDYETLLRPANYPEGVPGFGSVLAPCTSGVQVGVINLMGRVFMRPLDCPFKAAQREIEKIRRKTKIILVDIHAEATSEKQAMGWYLDGQVSAVIGTHTHVQTADEQILPQGTAYLTDAGMTGPFDSIIGTKKEAVLERFMMQMPNKFDVAKGDVRLQGALLTLDEQTGRSLAIERLNLPFKDARY